MNKKTIIFTLLILIFIGLIILGLISLINSNKITKPSPIPIYTPQPTSSTLPPQPDNLYILKVSPEENIATKYLPITRIDFTFSSQIKPENFHYTVSPQVKTLVKEDSNNTIILSPETSWKEGITTITILTSTKTSDGKFLQTPFIYKINTAIPELPPADAKGI